MRQAYVIAVDGHCPKHGQWRSVTFTLAQSQAEAMAVGVQRALSLEPHNVGCPPNSVTWAFAGPVASEVIAEAARELAQEEE